MNAMQLGDFVRYLIAACLLAGPFHAAFAQQVLVDFEELPAIQDYFALGSATTVSSKGATFSGRVVPNVTVVK